MVDEKIVNDRAAVLEARCADAIERARKDRRTEAVAFISAGDEAYIPNPEDAEVEARVIARLRGNWGVRAAVRHIDQKEALGEGRTHRAHARWLKLTL